MSWIINVERKCISNVETETQIRRIEWVSMTKFASVCEEGVIRIHQLKGNPTIVTIVDELRLGVSAPRSNVLTIWVCLINSVQLVKRKGGETAKISITVVRQFQIVSMGYTKRRQGIYLMFSKTAICLFKINMKILKGFNNRPNR